MFFDVSELYASLFYFAVLGIELFIGLFLYQFITAHDDMKLIKEGNSAVGIDFLGKIVGLGIVMNAAIHYTESLIEAAIWGGVGFVLLIIGYFIYDILTPAFKVSEELEKNNNAVAIVSAAISIAIALIVSGSIA